MTRALSLLGLLVFLAGCASVPPAPPLPAPPDSARAATDTPPPAPREFRAVWVASVANIDWPSRPGLPDEAQIAEMTAILDRARGLRLNAIILQIRPAADALYPSELEPWSEYLTGEQGKAPGYDPLARWIAEAHRRGLELHAWLNPYRARHPSAKSPLAPSHLARTNPDAVKAYGDLLWMDPGEPAAAERTLAVIRDVVRRYDLDGIHIDDYFYPYPVNAPGPARPGEPPATVEFPDDPAWSRYVAAGGALTRADWRRDNVNRLVERMYRTIKDVKPGVKFGVSPFGVGRPDRRPPGIEGFSQYDRLYADVELWFERGWMDYLAPQLYWPRDRAPQAFGTLLQYWVAQNKAGRHVWPGLFTSSINDSPRSWAAEEIAGQIARTRAEPGATGHIHFSEVALREDRKGVRTLLGRESYTEDALVPATPWLAPPAAAGVSAADDGRGRVELYPAFGETIARYAVWRKQGGRWRFAVQPASEPTVDLAPDPVLGPVERAVVTAVDRLGRERAPLTLVPRSDGGGWTAVEGQSP